MLARIKRKAEKLAQSGFAKNVSVLAGGTAISQLIAISVLPLLTRIYSPEDFSALAIYASILTLFMVVSCLRLEIAIPMPKEDMKAKELLVLSMFSVIVIASLSAFALYIFSDEIHALTQDRLSGYLWLIPVGVMLSGFYSAFQYWFIRKKNFVLISRTRVSQAVSGAGTQIVLGYMGFTPIGLLLGQVLIASAGVWGLVKNYYKSNPPLYKEVRKIALKKTFREYDRFPKYSTWEALCNSAASQVPILLIATYAAGPEVGFMMLATRLLSAPMRLIGGAVSQVYLSEAPVYYQQGKLERFTAKTIWSLAKVGGPPLLLAGVSAPYLVPLIFGADWERTGVLISWMVPWFIMQFISSPVSMSLHITSNQRAALALQVIGFVFRAGSVLYAGLYYSAYVAEVYSLTGFIFYTVYILVILKITRKM